MRILISLIFCTVFLSLPCFGQAQLFGKTLKWELPRGKIFLFDLSPDGRYILLVNRFNWNLRDLDSNSDLVGDIEVIETETGKSLSKLSVCDGKFGLGLDFPRSGISRNNRLAISCRKGTAEIWDIKQAKLLQTIYPSVAKEVDFYTLSPDGERIVTFESDNYRSNSMAVLSDVNSGKTIKFLTPKLGGQNAINAAFTEDGKVVAVSYNGYVYLWNTANGELIYKLVDTTLKGFPSHTHFPNSLIYLMLFTPDGKRLITSSTDKFAKIWNTETGELEHTLGSHKSRIDMGGLSSDGKIAAIIGDNKQVEFWDVETGKLMQKFKADSYSYLEYSFSPDNLYFFSPTEKGASIWDVKSGYALWTEKTSRAAMSSSWKWYLSFDKKEQKLKLFEVQIKK